MNLNSVLTHRAILLFLCPTSAHAFLINSAFTSNSPDSFESQWSWTNGSGGAGDSG